MVSLGHQGESNQQNEPREFDTPLREVHHNSRLESAGATSYTYDWVGNRTDITWAEYNSADELTITSSHEYDYLGTGSLHHQFDTNHTTQKTYTYTAANLPASVAHAGAGTSSMTWDADGNRVSFTSSTGGTWGFMYDITAGIPAVIEEIGPSSSAYYIREPDGSLIARMSGANTHYYHFDALGSARRLSDAGGAFSDSYSPGAWGYTIHYAGNTQQPYQYVGQLGYYTHYQDANLPLLQLGVRFYDPSTGRFTQRDSIVYTNNAYWYAHDNPEIYVDPSGKVSLKPIQPILPGLVPLPAACSLYLCRKCDQAQSSSTSDEMDKRLKQIGGWGPGNALGHCIRACNMTRNCQAECFFAGGPESYLNNFWELYNPPPYWRNRRMDIHNNNAGIECAKTSKSCVECCEQKFGEKGGLDYF